MSPRICLLLATLLFASPLAQASVGPLSLSLDVAQRTSLQRYATTGGNACLVLDAGRALGDQDTAGLKKLIADLDVHAGPGLTPENEPAGSLLYTYSLVPELKGSRLIYRGLLSSSRGNAVQVTSRGPASLADTVARDLGFSGASFVITHSCD